MLAELCLLGSPFHPACGGEKAAQGALTRVPSLLLSQLFSKLPSSRVFTNPRAGLNKCFNGSWKLLGFPEQPEKVNVVCLTNS